MPRCWSAQGENPTLYAETACSGSRLVLGTETLREVSSGLISSAPSFPEMRRGGERRGRGEEASGWGRGTALAQRTKPQSYLYLSELCDFGKVS